MPSPAKPKLPSDKRRAREAHRLKAIRLRVTIGREPDDRGITSPAEIGAALGLPTAEAAKLLTQRQWREGDVALLEAAAARLGLLVPVQGDPVGPGTRPDKRRSAPLPPKPARAALGGR